MVRKGLLPIRWLPHARSARGPRVALAKIHRLRWSYARRSVGPHDRLPLLILCRRNPAWFIILRRLVPVPSLTLPPAPSTTFFVPMIRPNPAPGSLRSRLTTKNLDYSQLMHRRQRGRRRDNDGGNNQRAHLIPVFEP